MGRTKLLIKEDKSTGLEHELNHAEYNNTKDQPSWLRDFGCMLKQIGKDLTNKTKTH